MRGINLIKREREASRLLRECRDVICQLADQQAMPDDFYEGTLQTVERFLALPAAPVRAGGTIKTRTAIRPDTARDVHYQQASAVIGGDLDVTRAEFEALQQRIANAFSTIQQEARAAAFKDCITELCIDCAEGDEPTFDAQAKWYYHDAETVQAVGCAASKLRILFAALEAATTKQPEVKEGDDGQHTV